MINEIYIAGFVDGEGYFGLKPLKNNHAQPRFTIVNTNYVVLAEIKRFFSWFKIHSKIVRTVCESAHQKNCWTLEVMRRRSVLAVAQLLLPFLEIKRRKAAIIIEYIKYREAEGKLGKDFENERLALLEEMKLLNKRGPV